MTVQDIIRDASHSVVNQLAVKANEEAMISYVNQALQAVYEEFQLKTDEQIIVMQENVTIYSVASDCIVVLAAYDEDGNLLPLNDEKDPFSVMTPSYNEIQVPNPVEGEVLSVIYLAEPPVVTATTDVLPVPRSMIQPMLMYIGFLAHSSIDGGIQTENNTHYMRYKAAVDKVRERGLVPTDDTNMDLKFDRKGFV